MRTICTALCFLALAIAVGCTASSHGGRRSANKGTPEAAEKLAYESALQEGTREAIVAFIEKHPEGEFSARARESLEELCFCQAEEKGTVEAWSALCRLYTTWPYSRHLPGSRRKEALSRLDDLSFQQAAEDNTERSLTNYVYHFPAGAHLLEAYSKRARINEEEGLRDMAISDYRRIVNAWPDSPFAGQARKRIEELSKESRRQLEARDFERAVQTNTIQSLSAFLEKHENGRFSPDVRKRLGELRQQLVAIGRAVRRALWYNIKTREKSPSRFGMASGNDTFSAVALARTRP